MTAPTGYEMPACAAIGPCGGRPSPPARPRRRSRWGSARLLVGMWVALCASAHGASRAEAQAVWVLWQRYRAAPTDHVAVVRLGESFLQRFPNGELNGIVRGCMAWHAWRAGDTNGALRQWNAMLSETGAVGTAAAEMARRWLTRWDREAVVRALRAWYARHAMFPDSLDALRELPADQQPPWTDRFGTPWQYSPTSYRHIPGTRGHRFRLTSSALGDASDMRAAMARDWPPSPPPQPIRRLDSAIQFQVGTDRPVLSAGARVGRWRLVLVDDLFVTLSDGDYWWLERTPPASEARP